MPVALPFVVHAAEAEDAPASAEMSSAPATQTFMSLRDIFPPCETNGLAVGEADPRPHVVWIDLVPPTASPASGRSPGGERREDHHIATRRDPQPPGTTSASPHARTQDDPGTSHLPNGQGLFPNALDLRL
jgi:hypothetical protein